LSEGKAGGEPCSCWSRVCVGSAAGPAWRSCSERLRSALNSCKQVLTMMSRSLGGAKLRPGLCSPSHLQKQGGGIDRCPVCKPERRVLAESMNELNQIYSCRSPEESVPDAYTHIHLLNFHNEPSKRDYSPTLTGEHMECACGRQAFC
jgi:hypothetical protein